MLLRLWLGSRWRVGLGGGGGFDADGWCCLPADDDKDEVEEATAWRSLRSREWGCV